MSKFVEANQKIEKTVVGAYQSVEDTVVAGYKHIEDRFVDLFLRRDGETIEESKVRLQREQDELKKRQNSYIKHR